MMFKTFTHFSLLTLLLSISLNLGCKSNSERNPSSIKNISDIQFNLITNNYYLNLNYDFELVSLYDLLQNKVLYKKHNVNLFESKKAFNDWHSELKNIISLNPDIINIKIFNHNTQITNNELVRLDRALDNLRKMSDKSEITLRQQIEVVTAFNQKFKKPLPINRNAALLPIILTLKPTQDFALSESSFKINTRNTLAINELRKPDTIIDASLHDVCVLDSAGYFNCQQKKYSFIFGNSAKAASFNSKIYHHLGYFVPEVNYKHLVKVRFDRQLLLNTNIDNTNISAQLKNGNTLDYLALTRQLWPYCKSNSMACFKSASLYNKNFEQDIQYLIINKVALTEEHGNHVFGHWSFDELDHNKRTELKALLIVGAFTSNYDLRTENNKLIWSAKNFEIQHQIQNLNAGFGRGSPDAEFNLNAMKWEVFKIKTLKTGQKIILIDGFSPLMNHKILAELSLAEAQWIVRQIANISEPELLKALEESGFNNNERSLALEKLVSLQKNMIEVFGLNDEFSALTQRRINKNLKL